MLGHRGARLYAPENTLPAFDLALRHGADGFEFDVRLTRDRHTIICHDPKLNRLTVGRQTLRRLRESCIAVDEYAPSLDDVLDHFRDSFLNIEVKVRGIELIVAQAVKRVRPRQLFHFIVLAGRGAKTSSG